MAETHILTARAHAGRGGAVRLSGAIHDLLPDGVVAAELVGEADPARLLPAERDVLAGFTLRRARDFTAGRLCARHALRQLGVTDHALTRQSDGRPQWPCGITGSITHSGAFCAAVVAPSARVVSVGLDSTIVGDVTPEVWPDVFKASERRWLAALSRREQAEVAALLFSAKEAFYKCQYPVTRQWLEFDDVTVDIAGWHFGMGVFTVRPRPDAQLFELSGRFAFRDGLVITATALTPQ